MYTLREYICICTHAHTLTHTHAYTRLSFINCCKCKLFPHCPDFNMQACTSSSRVYILTLCILLLKMYIYMIKAHADHFLNLRHLKTDDTHFIHYKLHVEHLVFMPFVLMET